MQQNKIPILCTRPLPEWLIAEAATAGMDIEVVSFIETEAIQTIEVQQEIEQALLQSAVVIFTSMNAVEAVAEQLDDQHPDWSIYAIGTATKRLVAEHFGENLIAGTANDAAELAERIVEDGVADEVIFFCGDQRREELPEILRKANIEVNEITVYQTIELPHEIKPEYWGILFFSPSAVRSFFKKNKPAEKTVLFAIGNTTAKEIQKFTANTIIISDEPGKENLVQKMITYFS